MGLFGNINGSTPFKEQSVLSQVTNSFLPTQPVMFEGKGEMMDEQMPMRGSAVAPQKKTTQAADSKKKWMSRI